MTQKRLILVKASIAGDWLPNSCMSLVKVTRRGRDVDGLYRILGLTPDATESEIKTAAKKRMLETHPDIGGDSEEFELVLKAYRTLSDAGSRAVYDSREHAASLMITKTCEPTLSEQSIEHQKGRACFYKGVSDMLSPSDIESVYEWLDMVMQVAHEFGAVFDVKVGVSAKINGYILQDGIAIKPNKAKPDKAMAKCYVLYKMTQGEQNVEHQSNRTGKTASTAQF